MKQECASCKIYEQSLEQNFDTIAMRNSERRKEIDALIALKMKQLDDLGTKSNDSNDRTGRTTLSSISAGQGDYRVTIKQLQREVDGLLKILEKENEEYKQKLEAKKRHVHAQFHRQKSTLNLSNI